MKAEYCSHPADHAAVSQVEISTAKENIKNFHKNFFLPLLKHQILFSALTRAFSINIARGSIAGMALWSLNTTYRYKFQVSTEEKEYFLKSF